MFYQGKGAYARLHQQSGKDIEDAFSDATDKVFYDDPLNLAIPYAFFLERLPEPSDGALKSMISLTLILFIYFYPVVRVLIIHWYRQIFASILAKDNMNMFVWHGIQSHAKLRPITTLYAREFSTADDHIKYYFSCDTDGIPFVIDKSVTKIIII